jgi:hypothetical protein
LTKFIWVENPHPPKNTQPPTHLQRPARSPTPSHPATRAPPPSHSRTYLPATTQPPATPNTTPQPFFGNYPFLAAEHTLGAVPPGSTLEIRVNPDTGGTGEARPLGCSQGTNAIQSRHDKPHRHHHHTRRWPAASSARAPGASSCRPDRRRQLSKINPHRTRRRNARAVSERDRRKSRAHGRRTHRRPRGRTGAHGRTELALLRSWAARHAPSNVGAVPDQMRHPINGARREQKPARIQPSQQRNRPSGNWGSGETA